GHIFNVAHRPVKGWCVRAAGSVPKSDVTIKPFVAEPSGRRAILPVSACGSATLQGMPSFLLIELLDHSDQYFMYIEE
ncbi:hypothetical protein MVA78_24565, partial [Salmonella sp. L-S3099]|uniref:hypothetical protein n=1 Tax=Salmonella sp. L-S3099 TaxID=2933312 RepID=UPI001FF5BB91